MYVVWAFIVILLFLHFDLSEIIAFAHYPSTACPLQKHARYPCFTLYVFVYFVFMVWPGFDCKISTIERSKYLQSEIHHLQEQIRILNLTRSPYNGWVVSSQLGDGCIGPRSGLWTVASQPSFCIIKVERWGEVRQTEVGLGHGKWPGCTAPC